MTVAAAILMKDPALAKTRLEPALAHDAREKLALLLFDNALDFLVAAHDGPVGVVTRSPVIAERTRSRGAMVIEEPAGGDINAAAGLAADWACGIGADALLVLHADIPRLEAAELGQMLAAGRRSAVVIARSRDQGTNALLLSPPDAMPFRFGRDSAAAHDAAARAAGLEVEQLVLPHLSRDLDRPEDLRGFASGAFSPSPGLRFARPPSPRRGEEVGDASDIRIEQVGEGGGTPLPMAERVAERSGGRVRGHAGGSHPATCELFALPGIGEVAEGDDLAAVIADAADAAGLPLAAGDIVVAAQKIVSKAEGRMIPLVDFAPSPEAKRLAAGIGKDVRKVEAILRESTGVVRARKQPPDGLLITRHRHGWICANAGIDESNLGHGRAGMLLLLPEDPDASARTIRAGLESRFGGPIGVVVSDTFGRPWRNGLVNVAIGVAGVPVLIDWSTRTDAYGRGLKATLPAFADEVSATAGLLMGKDAGLPVVVLRGLGWQDDPEASARQVLRPIEQELFL